MLPLLFVVNARGLWIANVLLLWLAVGDKSTICDYTDNTLSLEPQQVIRSDDNGNKLTSKNS